MTTTRLTSRTCVSLAALGLVAVALFNSCGGATPERRPNTPEWLEQPLAASAPVAGPTAIEPILATVADPSRAIFDPSTVTPILADARLEAVKALVEREAYKGAADALARILRDLTPATQASEDEEPAWYYQLGLLYKRAGLPANAVRAFDHAAASDWILADYARFMAGDILVDMNEPAEALARLASIEPGSAIDDEVALATARGHAATRQVDEAAKIWRAYLARDPKPKGWQLVALRYAKALLNQPSIAHAEEAVGVARQVIYASPGGRGVGEARELEKMALATIPSTRRGKLDNPQISQLVARARDLAEARQGREAIHAAKKAIKALGNDDVTGELGCEAHLAHGRGLAKVKRYAEASDELGIAIERCEGLDRQVVALFVGARSALRGGELAAARRRYAQLERAFPKHSYADDARLHGAETARELGDIAGFTRMLQTIADAYPGGDMVDNALFALARSRIAVGDWAGAITPLEKAKQTQARGRPYYAEGRPHYYAARAKIELGQAQPGIEALQQVIRDFPLSYYMVLAYARLHAHDPDLARSTVAEAMAKEPSGNFLIADHAELHRPGFLRSVELVRQSDGKRALAELERLGVRDDSAHPSLLWASAFLLARIDSPAESHGVLRSSSDAWMEHYPAGIWRNVWKVAYPRPFKAVVDKEVKRSGIAPHLAYAIMREESAFAPRVVSHAGAIGLMQLIIPTAKAMGRSLGIKATASTLKEPATNIALGCKFLANLQRRFDYNPLLCIPGYNAGPGAPMKWVRRRPADDFDLWVERIPYKETRRYTKRVIRSMAAYSMLYGRGMEERLMRLPLAVQPVTDTDM